MKHINKKYLSFFALAMAFIQVSGYEMSITNATNRELVFAIKKRAGIKEKYYQIAYPGMTVIQPWNDANCLESIQWAELNTKLPLRGGLDLIDNNRGGQIPPDKQNQFDETFFNKTTGKGLYLWNSLKIVMLPTEIYQSIADNAVNLFKGFDQAVCQAIQFVLLALIDTAFAPMQKSLVEKQNALKQAIADQTEGQKQNLNPVAQQLLNNLVISLQAQVNALLSSALAYARTKIKEFTDEGQCFIAFGQIAQAASKLKGATLCKSRSFVVQDTGQQDSLTGMPLLIAETGEGE